MLVSRYRSAHQGPPHFRAIAPAGPLPRMLSPREPLDQSLVFNVVFSGLLGSASQIAASAGLSTPLPFFLSSQHSLSYYIYFTCLCFSLTPPLLECKLCEGGDVFVWDFVCVGICLFCSTLFTVVSLAPGIVLVAQWVLNKDLLSE